jgi:hypothetical protein
MSLVPKVVMAVSITPLQKLKNMQPIIKAVGVLSSWHLRVELL